MNKVFKVIWNEARNAYVVVSEIAKNRGSKSCSTKKLLAMLIATGVMTCASFDVLAAEPMAAATAQSQYVAFGDETADLKQGDVKIVDDHRYIYDATNKYWVREGYTLMIEENGKLHTPLSANGKSADVAYTGGGDTGSILQSVASTVSANGTVTNMGESLNRITASAFAGVSHGGGTAVAGDWSYIIQDSSWKDKDLVASGNYKDGYADLIDKDNGMPKGFKTAEDPKTELNWDATKQTYTYKGKPVDYSNVYVIDGKIGVFTNKDGSEVYKGTVFGKNNEILMTVKDADNKFYSYWASEVTDPSATMQSYRMTEYKKDLSVLEENDNKLHRDDIKEVTMTTDASTNSATIGLVRNGNTEAGAPVKGAITVTSGGGTEGNDTFVKISNGTANQTFATGSKVEVKGPTNAITGIKVNGQEYTIKQGSGIEVTQDTTKKTTTITVDGNETIITDTDTTYTAGNGIEINGGNAISVSKNLTGMESIQGAGEGKISFDGANVKVNNTTFSENSVVVGGGTDGKTPVTINGTDGVVSGLHNTNIGYTDFATKGNAATEEQLKKVMDAGWKFTTDSGTQTTVTVGEAGNEVKFNGDAANIDVTNTGKDIKVALKKNLTVDSVKAGETTVNTNGLTIGNGDNGIVLNKTNVSMGNQQIHNVAAGTADTDAVNFSQLKETNTKIENLKVDAGKHTTLVKGENTTVEKIETADGHFEYKVNAVDTKYTAGSSIAIDTENNNAISVKLQDGSNLVVNSNGLALNTALTGIQSITGAGAGSISFNGGNVKVNQNTFNSDGRIQNVAAGTETKDAVNFGQLDATNKKVDNLTTEVGKGWTVATENGTATKVVAGDTVKFSGADDNIKVSNIGKDVKVELNKKLTVDSVKAGDFFMDKNEGVGYKGKAYITSSGLNANGQTITNVKAGEAETDAVNVGQLNAVKAEASKKTTLSNGKNTTVTSVTTEGQTDYQVNVAGDLKDITSVANGASKIKLNTDSIIIANENKTFAITNSGIGMSYVASDYSTKAIMLGEHGTTISGGLDVAGSKITGVAAGTANTDAVNVGQLNTVKNELQASDKHLVANTASADGSYKPDANGNISLRVEDQNKNGYDVVIKDVASKAELGEVANRVTNVENKVTQIETDVTNIKNNITNIQTDVTDIKTDITNINTRVDKVEALAGKHTTLEKNGTNINVEETEVDGHKNYKVNLNKDITLGDENGNKVSISGTNGTITATGDITTANRINADKDGKLADIDVTGNKLSNGNSSITLDGTNVKVNDKVTVDKDGKISGVAKGDISNTSTDAVNGSQLYDTNTHITNVENQVISNSNRIGQLSSRVNKVGAGAAALAALHPMDFDPDDKLTFSAGYGNYAGQNAAAIGAYYRPDEKVMFSVAGTVGNGENMVNAGVSFALDRTNHVSNSRTALAREVIDLRGQLAEMGAKMARMEKTFGMLDESKTKLFPDIPANHWAYEYIAKLAGNGYIEGYPDGNFGGDRLMTRYEFASMLYRAIEKGAALEERIIKEFEPELGRIRVDRISGEDGDRNKIERVRVNATKGERDHYGNKLK